MQYTRKQIKIGRISTSETELKDLIKAWIAISIAFAIVLSKSIFSSDFYAKFVIASLTVGIGFLLHELGHKVVAQRYGCFAEFRSFDNMLLLAIAMSFFGFIIAAPGAVMISGKVNKERKLHASKMLARKMFASMRANSHATRASSLSTRSHARDMYGKISAAGPIVNLVLALVFLALTFAQLPKLFKDIAYYGFVINSWLALFNMIPFWLFDGYKVLKWNKLIYGGITAIAFAFMLLQSFIALT